MYSKQRKLPLEVSSWMEKDLTLRKITANSRLLTNDTRQNIVLSRQFFSDLLTLSFERYRTLAQHDFDKKMFLRHQQNKSDSSMPGLRPYVDHLTYEMNRPTTSRMQSSRKGDNPFISASSQSFLSRTGTKSDPMFNRRQQSHIRNIKTAEIMKSRPNTTAIATNQRPPTGRQMSRERLNRLAQPKGYRFKSAMTNSDHVRSIITEGATTAEEMFDELNQEISATQDITSEKPKGVVHDKRFRHLLEVFSKKDSAETSNLRTCRSIVAANTSLQDDEGQWKMEHPSVSNRKTELKHHRQMLLDKLNSKFDVFLIDVGA